MKKILVTTLVACALVTSAMAQGIITISASAGSIKYTDDLTTLINVPAGNPAQIPGQGNLNIAFYGAAPGTALSIVGGVPDLSGWTIQTSALLQRIAPVAGGMPAVNVTMDAASGAAGEDIQLEVVAWTGTFATFQEAVAGGAYLAWTGDALSGGGLGWTQGTGTSTSPAVINKGANAFNTLVLAPIPEPSSFALMGLGAAALLIFRRRK